MCEHEPPIISSLSSLRGFLMPANRFNGYTDYGVGIGLRVPHYDHILSKKPSSIGLRSSQKTTWSTADAL